jgi:NADP-dependent 3-hydroxy acid dehydrogenase YdfG
MIIKILLFLFFFIYTILYKLTVKKYNIKNKVIIVTGASSGIGKACVKKFNEKGATVVLAARNIDKLKQVKNELKIKNGMILKCDVSKKENCNFSFIDLNIF